MKKYLPKRLDVSLTENQVKQMVENIYSIMDRKDLSNYMKVKSVERAIYSDVERSNYRELYDIV